MISKKIKVTLLAAVLMVTGVVQTALADTSTQKDTKTKIECGIENNEEDMMTYSTPSFKDLIGEIKKNIKKEDLAKLEKIYKEIEALEKAEKYEESGKKWNEFYNILDKCMPEMTGLEEMSFEEVSFEETSFEDLIGEMKKDIKKEDLAKLEKTYKEIETLEKAEKYEESDKKWNEFYNILDKYMSKIEEVEDMDFEEMSFEDFIGEMKKDIKKEDLVKLEKIFKEAVALEKEEKFEAADKKWEAVFNILDEYMPVMNDFEDVDSKDMSFEEN